MSDNNQKIQELIARIWKEQDFKQKFLADPKRILAEAGLTFPAEVTVKVHINTPNTVNIVIPMDPAEFELSEETLNAVSGGEFTNYYTCRLATC
jgi:Nitrile hydratase, alpha chain